MALISLLFPATFSCAGNRLFALCAFHARVTYEREKIYGRVGVCHTELTAVNRFILVNSR